MTTQTITTAQSIPSALTGVNVTPMTFYAWDLKTLFPSAIAADTIETPAIDLNAVNPNCNKLLAQKSFTAAAADTLKLLVSPDGVIWYSAPLYFGGTLGGTASANPSAPEVSITGLPSMRYVKAQLTLAAAMSTQTTARLSLSLMRI